MKRNWPSIVSAQCPQWTFASSGVPDIVASYHSDNDGEDLGVEAWTGEVTGRTFLVRIRRGGRRDAIPVELDFSALETSRGVGDAR